MRMRNNLFSFFKIPTNKTYACVVVDSWILQKIIDISRRTNQQAACASTVASLSCVAFAPVTVTI